MWMPKAKGQIIKKKSEFLLFRPDLERKHRDHVEQRAEDEEWAKIEKMDDVVMFRQHQLARMRRRRMQNHLNATRSKSELHPANMEEHAQAILRRGQGPGVKDWRFYRRTGAVWTDLSHTPAERVHLVVTPAVLEGDAKAADHIQHRLAEEQAVNDAAEALQRERAAQTRALFRKRRAERNAVLGATISKPVVPALQNTQGSLQSTPPRRRASHHVTTKRRGWATSTLNHTPVSTRTMRLAQPRRPKVPQEEFFTADFKGLLLADDTSRIMAVSANAMRPPTTQPPRRASHTASRTSASGRSISAAGAARTRTRRVSAPLGQRAQTCPPGAVRGGAVAPGQGGSTGGGSVRRAAVVVRPDQHAVTHATAHRAERSRRSSARSARSMRLSPRSGATSPRGGPAGGVDIMASTSTAPPMHVHMDATVPVTSSTLRATIPTRPAASAMVSPTSPRRRHSTFRAATDGNERATADLQAASAAKRDIKTFDNRIAREPTFRHKGPHKFSRQTKEHMESPRPAANVDA